MSSCDVGSAAQWSVQRALEDPVKWVVLLRKRLFYIVLLYLQVVTGFLLTVAYLGIASEYNSVILSLVVSQTVWPH